jgi:hypothetical protein
VRTRGAVSSSFWLSRLGRVRELSNRRYARQRAYTCGLRRRQELRRVRSLHVKMLSRTFNLAHISSYAVVSQMRFSKRDISTLASRMPWRETTALRQVRTARRRYAASPEEAIAILLSRLSMPCRVEDLEQRFYRSKAAINEIFYATLECFIKWASPLVSAFQGDCLQSRAQMYARKIAAKSRNATQKCVGFIDGTLVEIARLSGLMQMATYSGHKRKPGLKWQVVSTPDGMLFHVFGPFEGRRTTCTSMPSLVSTMFWLKDC